MPAIRVEHSWDFSSSIAVVYAESMRSAAVAYRGISAEASCIVMPQINVGCRMFEAPAIALYYIYIYIC
jgi:hypothetical protein